MKDVSEILSKRLLNLDSSFSREWVGNFSRLMEFIYTNPILKQIADSIKEYAERKGLVADQVFTLTESSTKNTRKEFEKILDRIKNSPYAKIAAFGLGSESSRGCSGARTPIFGLL